MMNARKYKVDLKCSPLDFPAIIGLGDSSIAYHSEPKMNHDKLVLNITKSYVLTDMGTNKQHEVLSVVSVYEIPASEIKTREDVYEFYRDATLTLNEAYQYARTQLPTLFNITFPTQPIEAYKAEIDRVCALLNNRN